MGRFIVRLLLAASVVSGSVGAAASDVLTTDTAGVVQRGGVWTLAGRPFTGLLVEHGPARSSRMVVGLVEGRPDGREWRWYDDGRLESIRRYATGRKVGYHRGWWPDGTPRFAASYREDGFHGTYRAWFSNGRLSDFRHFSDGVEKGRQQGWTADGELFFNYEVRGGRRYGLINAKPCIPTGNTAS